MAKLDRRVEQISDERPNNGVWFYLKPGHQRDGQHLIHEDTISACRKELPNVTKCACAECLDVIAKAK